MSQQSQWRALSDVPGDLPGLIDQVGYNPLQVRIAYGTVRITKAGSEYEVECVGSGGGFCWERTWTKRRVVSFLRDTTDDPEFKRP
jgi:hypothetical protein